MAEVKITPINNGPYHIEGSFTIVTQGGRVIQRVEGEAWLCRCGQSSHKPFCDGTHRRVHFQSDLDAALSAPAAEGFEDVCGENEIGDGEIKGVRVGGAPVVLARVAGKLYAVGGICSHEAALLEDGDLDGNVLVCPLHDSGFDLATGQAVRPPATTAIPTYEVRVEAGRVFVSRQPR
jgi:nitrite reductase/ring-hydroxylating ferredoxin subunit